MRKFLFIPLIFCLIGCTNQTYESAFIPLESEIVEEFLSETDFTPKLQTTSLMFGGDNLIHSGLYKSNQTDDGYDFSSLYTHISDYFINADIAMINQETIINDIYSPSGYPRFSTPVDMLTALEGIGIDVVSLANNHVFDVNANGLENSLNHFANSTEILTTGAYLNDDDYANIRIIEENDTTFSFVSATESTNGLYISNSDLVLLQTSNEQVLLSRVSDAKALSDVCIVNVHWGYEYHNTPNSFQTSLATKLIDAGADIIIGHHPHVLQPIETIITDAGNKALVCYSLGNLMSSQNEIPRLIGGLMDIEVTKFYDKDIPYVEITHSELIPIVTHYTAGVQNVSAYPLSSYSDELAKTHAIYQGKLSVSYIEDYVAKVLN